MNTPKFWQHKSVWSHLLTPLSYGYRFGAWLDRRFTQPQATPIPVISIGNITAGGAGKTPTALALAPFLRTLGFTPHFLTRGYKSQTPLYAHRVIESDDWQQIGDEACLLATAAPTWVGRDRVTSVQAAAKAGATIAVCDDALQHHRLQKTLSLLVIDGPYGIGNGQLLPAGPLRESLTEALTRCHAVILIGEDAQQLAGSVSLPVFRATLEPRMAADFLATTRWLAFAGIGRPEKFFATLQKLNAPLAATRAFPDHHAYSEADLAVLTAQAASLGAKLITTEKDAVKLPPALRCEIATLPVELTFEAPDEFHSFLVQHLR